MPRKWKKQKNGNYANSNTNWFARYLEIRTNYGNDADSNKNWFASCLELWENHWNDANSDTNCITHCTEILKSLGMREIVTKTDLLDA